MNILTSRIVENVLLIRSDFVKNYSCQIAGITVPRAEPVLSRSRRRSALASLLFFGFGSSLFLLRISQHLTLLLLSRRMVGGIWISGVSSLLVLNRTFFSWVQKRPVVTHPLATCIQDCGGMHAVQTLPLLHLVQNISPHTLFGWWI